jgi:hypothetical protein
MIEILCEERGAILPERVQAHRIRVPHQRYLFTISSEAKSRRSGDHRKILRAQVAS